MHLSRTGTLVMACAGSLALANSITSTNLAKLEDKLALSDAPLHPRTPQDGHLGDSCKSDSDCGASGRICVQDSCADKSRPGEKCTREGKVGHDSDCHIGVCRGGICGGKANGEACASSLECKNGLGAGGGCRDGVCGGGRPRGKSCTDDFQCKEDSYCAYISVEEGKTVGRQCEPRRGRGGGLVTLANRKPIVVRVISNVFLVRTMGMDPHSAEFTSTFVAIVKAVLASATHAAVTMIAVKGTATPSLTVADLEVLLIFVGQAAAQVAAQVTAQFTDRFAQAAQVTPEGKVLPPVSRERKASRQKKASKSFPSTCGS